MAQPREDPTLRLTGRRSGKRELNDASPRVSPRSTRNRCREAAEWPGTRHGSRVAADRDDAGTSSGMAIVGTGRRGRGHRRCAGSNSDRDEHMAGIASTCRALATATGGGRRARLTRAPSQSRAPAASSGDRSRSSWSSPAHRLFPAGCASRTIPTWRLRRVRSPSVGSGSWRRSTKHANGRPLVGLVSSSCAARRGSASHAS